MSDTKDMSSTNNPIPFGSEQHEHLLRSAHKITREQATAIITQFKKDSSSMPYELYLSAKNYMTALTTKPVVTARVEASMG